jgi:sulfate permease, SulP family
MWQRSRHTMSSVFAFVEVDFTALEAVEAVRAELARAGTVFALARVKQDLLARLESFGLAGKIGADRLFPTLPTAVAAYERWVRQQPPGSWENAGEPRPDQR